MASNYTHYFADGLVWGLVVLSLCVGDKPGEEGGSVTPVVLQVYFRDHAGSLDNPNMHTQFEIIHYHSDFVFESTFRICSPSGISAITLPLCQ